MKIFLFIILCGLTFLSSSVFAGACDVGENLNENRKIDGPANIRKSPTSSSEIITSLPNQKEVTVKKNLAFKEKKNQQQYWLFIEWQENGKTLSGWTHENNIICD